LLLIHLVNFRRLVMLEIFQEVCDSWLQRSRLLLSIVGLEFVSDEVPEQAEVRPFFSRFLKIFCLHVLALRYCPQRIEIAQIMISRIERYN
jgi:hypothetical protein